MWHGAGIRISPPGSAIQCRKYVPQISAISPLELEDDLDEYLGLDVLSGPAYLPFQRRGDLVGKVETRRPIEAGSSSEKLAHHRYVLIGHRAHIPALRKLKRRWLIVCEPSGSGFGFRHDYYPGGQIPETLVL